MHTPSALMPTVFTFLPCPPDSRVNFHPHLSTHPSPPYPPGTSPSSNEQGLNPTLEIIHKLFLLSGMFFHPLPQTPPTQFLISLHSFNLLLITPNREKLSDPKPGQDTCSQLHTVPQTSSEQLPKLSFLLHKEEFTFCLCHWTVASRRKTPSGWCAAATPTV